MSAPSWVKLPPKDGRSNPCACCPPIPALLPLDRVIAVGFGDAHVNRDREIIYTEPHVHPCDMCWGAGTIVGDDRVTRQCVACGGKGDDGSDDPYWDVAEVEKLATADPDHDWRIVLFGPLHGEEYQRHGDGEWVLVASNQGFA